MKNSMTRIFLFSICFAGLGFLGLPGKISIWPLLFFALLPLFFLCQIGSGKTRFLAGLGAGWLFYLLQLYWIVIVLGRYGGLPWFVSVPACLLLAFYMALYTGAFVYITGFFFNQAKSVWLLWLAPFFWVGLDWLRANLFTGFPWMDLGYGLHQAGPIIQVADLFGHHFLTFLLVCINAALFLFFQAESKRQGSFSLALAFLLLMCVVGYGHFRTEKLQKIIANAPSATIGIVQGNIDQSKKWSPNEQQRTIDIYNGQSIELLKSEKPPSLIVWPETALPFFPSRSPLFLTLGEITREYGVNLLTGSPWFEVINRERKEVAYYNSAFLLGPDREIGDIYFKTHLVPFGEYVPLKKVLPFLAPLVEAAGDFTPGKVEEPLSADGIKSGVLICFESIFPDIARQWVHNGSNLLVNLTNDAWYGRSSAPYQSLAMSIFRAVETRRGLVRSANTGISAFIDPFGGVNKKSDIFTLWAESETMPLIEVTSFHSRYGYLFGPFCFVLLVLGLVFILQRRIRWRAR